MTAAYLGMYHKAPYGMGLVNPIEPAGQGHYRNDPFVVLGGCILRWPVRSVSLSLGIKLRLNFCVFFLKIPVIHFPVFRLSLLPPRIHRTFSPLVPRTFSIETFIVVISKLKSTRSPMRHLSNMSTMQSPCPAHKLSPSKWWTLRDRRYSCCLRRSSRSIGISRVSLHLGSLNTVQKYWKKCIRN